MAACSAEGAYGRQRLWGALGWGLCSALAGVLITHAGVYAAFACHAVLLVAALPATLRLPFGPLHAKLAAHTQHDDGGGGDGGDGGGGMGGKDGGSKAGTAEQSPKPAAHAASGRRSVERFDSALEAAALLERGAGGHTHAGSCRGGSKGVCAGADEEEAAQLSQQDGSASAAGQQPRVQYWAGVGQLLRCPEAAIFLAMAITMGFGVGNIEGYLFLYLDELGGSEALMGLSLSVTCAAETLVFYHQNHLLRLGVRRCMHLVLAAFLVRMGAYAALAHAPSPWLVLPIEVLHGFTFALAWGGGCAYCAQLAPPGLEATTQGLFQGLYFGLGVAAGSAVGGHVYQRHGAQAVYVVACGVLAAGWALCSAAQAAVALFGRGSGDGSSPGYLRVAAVEMGGRSDSSSLDPPPGVKREASAERITGGIAAAASV